MVKYTPQEPPANIDPDLARYLSSEFNRIANEQHLRYVEAMGTGDAGPHIVPVAPADILILSYTLPQDVIAGAQWFFECTIENTNNQYDTVEFDVEFVGITRDIFGSQFVDLNSFSIFNASGFVDVALPKGIVINFYASAVKRTGLIVTDSRFWIIEG